MILTQNAENVLKTKDLDNVFQLLVGFHYDEKQSTEEVKQYTAVGSHISIKNYEDEPKIELCLKERCEYEFNI